MCALNILEAFHTHNITPWRILMGYQHIQIPQSGEKISVNSDLSLNVPNNPIIPYIEGDGIGYDITPVMIKVIDAAVKKAYNGDKEISWMEVFCGEKAADKYDGDWFPAETLEAIKDYAVSIKGPLTTPVGGGFRSLNVALRQELDLFVCQRPVRWFTGVPSPVKEPNKVDMCIFRENSEDIYAGIEWRAGTEEAGKVIDFLQNEMGVKKIRFDENCGIGVKPVSEQGTKRLVSKAIQYAIDQNKPSVTLVHKGNIMKYTEGAFRDWGFSLVKSEFNGVENNDSTYSIISKESDHELIIKDCIADNFLQEIILSPEQHEVIATLNLNGDYISDALAACVGGIGIAPGANINYQTGIAIFEATHGTAPKYAGKNQVNPGSLILSGEMMLRYMGWIEAADLVIKGMNGAISQKRVTYDFERLMDDATLLSCSDFGKAMIDNM